MKKVIFIIAALIIFQLSGFLYAEELTILFTGETYSSLYPCHCPVAPMGGVARRSTKLNELRKQNTNILLVVLHLLSQLFVPFVFPPFNRLDF